MGQHRSRRKTADATARAASTGRPSALVDTRLIYCGDCLDRLSSEPPPSGSGPRGDVEDRHASTAAYIDYMRPRCVELACVLKPTGSSSYQCDWHRRYGNGQRALGTG